MAGQGQDGGSSRLCTGDQLDIEPSKDTSIRLPLEESDRLARSTQCLVPSRQGEPFNLVTSGDHADTTVVLRRSVSDRLESRRADPMLPCPGRRIYGCLNPTGWLAHARTFFTRERFLCANVMLHVACRDADNAVDSSDQSRAWACTAAWVVAFPGSSGP